MPSPPNLTVFPNNDSRTIGEDGLNAVMLTRLYIEALLVDEELADQVWEAWDAGEIYDPIACWFWWLIAVDAIAAPVN